MTKTLSVTYDGEVLRPDEPLDLELNKHYQIIIQESPNPEVRKIVVEVEKEENAWDVLERMVGKYDGPTDWSAEHDHYLYGTPKHQERLADE